MFKSIVKKGESNKTYIVFHGYASNARKMYEYFHSNITKSKNDSFVFLEKELHQEEKINKWFPLTNNLKQLKNHVLALAPEVDREVARLIRFHKLGNELILIGHSQGAMLSIALSILTEQSVSKVVSMAGLNVLPNSFFTGKTGISYLFIHSSEDQLIPSSKMRFLNRPLENSDLDYTVAISSDFGHFLDDKFIRCTFEIVGL